MNSITALKVTFGYMLALEKMKTGANQEYRTQINPYTERSPFLHPDMKTLYFSSDGHSGLGKLDVYKTSRLSDLVGTVGGTY